MYSNFSKFGEGFKNLIGSVFNGDTIYAPVDEAFEYATKQTENKVRFPFISFYVNPNILLDNSNNSMDQYHDGINFQNPLKIYNEQGKEIGTNERLAKNQNFLYIILGYQIDIWGTDRYSTEQLAQELIFWLYENQQISTKLQGEDLNFTFEIDNQLIDNSDLALYQSQGKLYRFTLNINLQGVLLRTKNFFTLLKPKVVVNELKMKGEK